MVDIVRSNVSVETLLEIRRTAGVIRRVICLDPHRLFELRYDFHTGTFRADFLQFDQGRRHGIFCHFSIDEFYPDARQTWYLVD